MRVKLILALMLSFLAFSSQGQEQGQEANPRTVATFECIGIYYKAVEQGDCQVQYRVAGDADWRRGLDLVYDARDGEYRGSLVGLSPGAVYEIQLKAGAQTVRSKARTRAESFPEGKVTVLEPGTSSETVTISESGAPDAWHVVRPPEGAKTIIDVMNSADYNLVVDADYVIVRGLELKNAAVHAILIAKGRHDVVIEDCRATFWGRIGGPRSFGNTEGSSDSAVYADKGTSRLVIQRNLFEHPRGAANDWETGHPVGPQAVTIRDSKGGNVIRYNDIWSTEDHGFNDGIGGGQNYSFVGNVFRDSDVHGNIVRNCWDDAIEVEGGNMNVRVWGNYLDRFYNGIATACTSRGPLYVFRNVLAVSRFGHTDPRGGAVIKTGERDEFGGGRKYIFHNTALQPSGVRDAFTSHPNPNCISRNNIFHCSGGRYATDRESEPRSSYDYDLFTGRERGTARGSHIARGKPKYVESYYLEFYPASTTSKVDYGKREVPAGKGTIRITDPVISVPNPAIDAGQVLPGFNDDYTGEAPDLGAFERLRPPLRFGRRAYLKPDEGWAPWELY